MNYFATTLVVLAAYLWYANSINNEFAIVKKLLVLIYETIQENFQHVTKIMSKYHDDVIINLSKLHNMTKHSIDLILINSKKIDVINDKIDSLLQN